MTTAPPTAARRGPVLVSAWFGLLDAAGRELADDGYGRLPLQGSAALRREWAIHLARRSEVEVPLCTRTPARGAALYLERHGGLPFARRDFLRPVTFPGRARLEGATTLADPDEEEYRLRPW